MTTPHTPHTPPWLAGPVPGISANLQPVAHALLQTVEEAESFTAGFPDDKLWEGVAGLASVGFHLRHIAGVIDRLFTAARGEAISDAQRAAARAEGDPAFGGGSSVAELLQALRERVDSALDQLRATPDAELAETREVGARKLPATALGLLFHAADHAQRHTGQLLVTAKVLQQA